MSRPSRGAGNSEGGRWPPCSSAAESATARLDAAYRKPRRSSRAKILYASSSNSTTITFWSFVPPWQVAVHLGERDARRAVHREAVVAGRDRRDGHRLQAVPVGERERRAHRRRELLVLVALAHFRADGVQDVLELHLARARDDGRAGGGRADPPALLLHRGAALPLDHPGDTATEDQLLVRRVDDRLDVELGDVPLDQLEGGVVHRDDDAICGVRFRHGATGTPFGFPRVPGVLRAREILSSARSAAKPLTLQRIGVG